MDQIKYSCDQCDKSFARKDNLKRHINNCTGKQEFKLTSDYLIKKNLSQKKSLKPKEDLKCTECSKTFFRKDVLNRHVKSHTFTSTECSYCEKSFSRVDTLQRHVLNNHTKTFSNGDKIVFEQRHKKEANFVCTFCPKKYSQKNDLKNHISLTHKVDKFSGRV